jgi:hypothetical protein
MNIQANAICKIIKEGIDLPIVDKLDLGNVGSAQNWS